MINYTKKQNEYIREANRRWNFKTGAVRSGKSFVDVTAVVPMRIRERVGKPGLSFIIGVSKETIERNVLQPMREAYGSAIVGMINNRNIARICGEDVYCLGAEKVSQVAKIQGASAKYIYGDEVAKWHKDVFELIKSRLDKKYSCFDGSLNPEGANHWLKKFLDSDVDIYTQHYTIFDNPFLPESYVKNLCSEYEGTVYYERFILGRWKNAEGLVYDFREDYVTDDIPTFGEYYLSIDYGTINPFSVGLWCVNGEKAVRIKEIYYNARAVGKMKTDDEYCDMVDDFTKGYKISYVVVDPSAASFIAAMRKRRYTVMKAKNDVLDGIRMTAVMLKKGNIKIHSSCKNSIEEFNLYRWDEKSTEDAVIKENDHAMDEIRYFCYTVMRWRVGRTVQL